jgi:hypothetical protein
MNKSLITFYLFDKQLFFCLNSGEPTGVRLLRRFLNFARRGKAGDEVKLFMVYWWIQEVGFTGCRIKSGMTEKRFRSVQVSVLILNGRIGCLIS